MEVEETAIAGVLLLFPKVFGDDRGYFFESWNESRYQLSGIEEPFCQDNISYSQRGVLRGLHFQNPNPQGKLVSALAGEVFDVAVDIRVGSPTFGRWVGITLSAKRRNQLWIPPGLAHGFCVTSETAIFHYKCTDVYNPQAEKTIMWDDPDIGVSWPIASPTLSDKDKRGEQLSTIRETYLPVYGSVEEGGV